MSTLPFYHHHNHNQQYHAPPTQPNSNTSLKHCWVAFNFWVFGGRKLDRITLLSCLAFLILLSFAYYTTIYSRQTHSPTSDSPSPHPTPSEAGYGSLVWDYVGSFWNSPAKDSAYEDLPATEPWELHRDYAVVIDAGSSGSRVQVYSWKSHQKAQELRKRQGLPLDVLPGVERGVEHGEDWQFKEEPGISSFASNPDNVGAHVKSLLDFALTVIPTTSVETTPVYLMATAGMRLLPKEQQDAVLWAACQYMKSNYRFVLADCETHVKVITGEMEGIYGWVAVNYLLGGFNDARGGDNANLLDAAAAENANQQQQGPGSSTGVPGVRHTYGFLDMGGASTQIAFEPAKDVAAEHADDLTTVKLQTLSGREISHRVFVTTFLGFGSNEARRRYVESLVATSVNLSNNTTGVEEENLMLKDPCLPENLVLQHSPHQLIGEGSFKRCLATLLPLLNKDVPCPTRPCLFNGVHTPSVDFSAHSFVGISEYWYSSNDILGLGGVYDFYRFETAADKFCSTPWSQMEADLAKGNVYGPEVHLERLQTQCFKSAWIANVLHEGLRVPRVVDPAADVGGPKVDGGNRRPPLFQSVNSIKDIQVSWTLGAVLLQASRNVPVPLMNDDDGREGSRTEQKRTFSFPKVILLIVFVGVIVILVFRRRRFVRSSLPTYQSYQRQGDDSTTVRSTNYPVRFFFILRKGMEVFRNTRIAIASLVAPKGTRVVTVGGGGSLMSFDSYSAADVELDELVLQQTGQTEFGNSNSPLDSSNGSSNVVAVEKGSVRTVAKLSKYTYNRKRRGDVPDSSNTNTNPNINTTSSNGSNISTSTTNVTLPSSSTPTSSSLPQPHLHRPHLSISLQASYSNTPSLSVATRPQSPSPWSTNNVKPPSPALWSNAKVLTTQGLAVGTGPVVGISATEEDVADGDGYSMRRSHSGNCSGGK